MPDRLSLQSVFPRLAVITVAENAAVTWEQWELGRYCFYYVDRNIILYPAATMQSEPALFQEMHVYTTYMHQLFKVELARQTGLATSAASAHPPKMSDECKEEYIEVVRVLVRAFLNPGALCKDVVGYCISAECI